MKVQLNCPCGAKLILHKSWLKTFFAKTTGYEEKLTDRWMKRHASCHKVHSLIKDSNKLKLSTRKHSSSKN